jgi:hypothetical protein
MTIFLVAACLLVVLIFVYRLLATRAKILSYLESNFESVYEEIRLNYTLKDILIGNPEIIRNQLKQDKMLMSKEICHDSHIESLQRRYKIALWLTLISAFGFIILLVFGLRFLL